MLDKGKVKANEGQLAVLRTSVLEIVFHAVPPALPGMQEQPKYVADEPHVHFSVIYSHCGHNES